MHLLTSDKAHWSTVYWLYGTHNSCCACPYLMHSVSLDRVYSAKESPLYMVMNLTSEIVSQENSTDVRPANAFLKLMQDFSSVMTSVWRAEVLFTDEYGYEIFGELIFHLRTARKMIESTKAMPWVYRTICVFQINSEYRSICESIGKTLKGKELIPEVIVDKLSHNSLPSEN